jgi:uncharacterized protein YlxP (DUF503 family)
MIVGSLWVSLRLAGSRNLKDKRQILRSLLDRCRRLGVSAAEVGDQELWGNAELGFAIASSSRAQAEAVLRQVLALIEERVDVADADLRLDDQS